MAWRTSCVALELQPGGQLVGARGARLAGAKSGAHFVERAAEFGRALLERRSLLLEPRALLVCARAQRLLLRLQLLTRLCSRIRLYGVHFEEIFSQKVVEVLKVCL